MQNRINNNLNKIKKQYKCTYYTDEDCITLKLTQPISNNEFRHINFLLNPYTLKQITANNNKLHLRYKL